MTLNEHRLTIKYLPAQPLLQNFSEIYPNITIVKHFREDCPPKILHEFLESNSGTKIAKIEYSLKPSVAMVHFGSTPGQYCVLNHGHTI